MIVVSKIAGEAGFDLDLVSRGKKEVTFTFRDNYELRVKLLCTL